MEIKHIFKREVPSMVYPLGWSVIPRISVQRERWLGGFNVKGVPLVQPGQEVQPDQQVLRVERNSADGLAGKIAPASVAVPAGLRGRVLDVTRRGGILIESRVTLLQGVFGAGNQVAGVLTIWQATDSMGRRQIIPPGAILVVPGPLNFTLLRQAAQSGVVGIVASSISLRDLEGFLHTDFLQLLSCDDVELAQAQLPPMALCVTEGFGAAAMPAHIMNQLNRYQGAIALLSGVTSVRHDLFPELLISLAVEELEPWQPTQLEADLLLGAQVHVSDGPHSGALGTIDHLFAYEQVYASGTRARSARLRLEDGSYCVVPLVLIKRIG